MNTNKTAAALAAARATRFATRRAVLSGDRSATALAARDKAEAAYMEAWTAYMNACLVVTAARS